MSIILDGIATAAIIKSELKTRISNLSTNPGLGTILVGDDPGSHSYVAGKHRDCHDISITDPDDCAHRREKEVEGYCQDS